MKNVINVRILNANRYCQALLDPLKSTILPHKTKIHNLKCIIAPVTYQRHRPNLTNRNKRKKKSRKSSALQSI